MANYEKSLSSLLEAEDKANKCIRDAELRREKLLEDAVEQARNNINQLRAQMQSDFDGKKVDTTKEEAELKSKINAASAQNQKDYNNNKDKVIQMMVDRIISVRLDLQRNVVADFSSLLKDM